MKHLGDITKINGSQIEPVSVITFGSPCTRLSVAGRHDGFNIKFQCCGKTKTPHFTHTIKATDKFKYLYEITCPVCGERLTEVNESALFFHAVRIIKEMRKATNEVYPAFAVWENVPGAFSSNKGEDFRQVLQELSRLCDDTVSIPRPPKKWINAGSIMGDGWSIAWRILDAQYWGVPQRRRRIALVVDFGSNCAGEILFNPESVQWNPAPRGETRETPAGSAGIGAEIPGGALCRDHRAGEGAVGEACRIAGFNGYRSATGSVEYAEDRAPCITSSMPPNVCAGFMAGQGAKAGGIGYGEETAPTLKGVASGLNQIPCTVVMPFDTTQITSIQNGSKPKYNDPCHTIGANSHPPSVAVSYQAVTGPLMANSHPGGVTGQDAYSDMLIAFTQKRFGEYKTGIGTLTESVGGGASSSETVLACIGRFVRRLTPLECERLQGYPDGWTAIPSAKDTPRYKAIGNSIALPVFNYVLYHVSRYLPPDATLGSLFDGIGGFPLIWERLHGRGTARWASEIEPFPITVTTHHFPEAAHPTTGDGTCLHYAEPVNTAERSSAITAEAETKQH